MATKIIVANHSDVIGSHHRFSDINVDASVWHFDHLEPFVMHAPIELSPGNKINLDILPF